MKVFENWKLEIKNFRRGFTLLELLVTITIFVLITAALLIKNDNFKSDLLITNLAYEIALNIRESQIYGINVKSSELSDLGLPETLDYAYPYGIHFNKNTSTQFDIFVDAQSPQDGVFLTGEPIVKSYTIRGNNKIVGLCVVPFGQGGCTEKTVIDITFKRPDPEANIRADQLGTLYESAQITIQGAQTGGLKKAIEVRSTGQISVLPTPSPTP